MIYVNANESCLQAKEIPPNFKKRSRRDSKAWDSSSPNIVFLFGEQTLYFIVP